MGQRFRDVDATLLYDGRRRRAAVWMRYWLCPASNLAPVPGFAMFLWHGTHGYVGAPLAPEASPSTRGAAGAEASRDTRNNSALAKREPI